MHCVRATEDTLPQTTRRDGTIIGDVVVAALGFAGGLFGGIVLGSLLGRVNSDRLRHAVRSLRREERRGPVDPERLAAEVTDALRDDPATRSLDLLVRAVDADLLELTGTVPDDDARRAAGAVAAEAAGGAVVVNRTLVEGSDISPHTSEPASGTS